MTDTLTTTAPAQAPAPVLTTTAPAQAPTSATTPAPPARKPSLVKRVAGHVWRHLFLYFFLAVQALFLIWIVGGNVSAAGEAAQYADQVSRDAAAVGTAIGTGLIIGLWATVDVILGIGRGIWVLSTRRTKATA